MKKLSAIMLIVFCLASAVLAEGLPDPMMIGVGARSLAMGKAYVGVAEDGDAIFMNPAGIARIATPKLSSMYASLLGDVNYVVAGGVYPYGERSAIGAGYIGSSVSDVPLTDSTGASLGSGSWGNNVMFLSYGTYLSELFGLRLNLGRDVLVGGSLKYYSVGGTGTGISDGSGAGYDADLAILFPATNYLTVGLNAQNVIPTSMGGKITNKSTGQSDSLPMNLKVGAKVAVIGLDGSALSGNSSRKLNGLVDYDTLDGALHAGAEFWPTSNLALRVGADDRNLTAGVGLRVSGVAFDYAYHPYSGINENTTHFLSISYLGEPRKRELNISLEGPKDKAVIYDDHVTVKGKVDVKEGDEDAPKGPLSVKVNGVSVITNPDGSFTSEIPVEAYGKKLVQVEVQDTAGNSARNEARLVRLTSFADVPEGYWAKAPIENNATVGLVQGYPDQTFRPERALTRAELATLLVRAKGIKLGSESARRVFKDVKPGFWAAKYIELAQREGLVKGYPDRTFRPNNKINKAEGIAVLVRFDQLRLAEVDSKPYGDIGTNHWAAKYIQAAKDNGMLKFIERNRLRPKEALVRSESVEMLGKTSLAGGKVKDLYTWEKGFKPGTETRPEVKASIY